MSIREIMVRVTTPSFCAGAAFGPEGLQACAPILRKWARGQGGKGFVLACRARGWDVEWWAVKSPAETIPDGA